MIVEHPTLPNLLAPPQFTVAAREAFCRGRPKFQQMINLIGNVFDVELGGLWCIPVGQNAVVACFAKLPMRFNACARLTNAGRSFRNELAIEETPGILQPARGHRLPFRSGR